MEKPIYLLPFIWVYRAVATLSKYIIKGFIYISYLIYRFSFGFVSIFRPKIKTKTIQQARKLNYNDLQRIEKEERRHLKQAQIEIRKFKKQEQLIEQQNDEFDIYSDTKKVKIKGKKKDSFFHQFINSIKKLPSNIKHKLENNDFSKNKRNQQMMKREALLIDFNGEEAEKSDTKLLYEYTAKDPEGNIIKGYFEAFSKVEVHSFLLSEGFEVYSIKTNWWIRFAHGRGNVNTTRIKIKDLIFFLTQLSTYIKAGIPLVEALKILSRQYKKKPYQRIFKGIIYDLTMGESFSDALTKQNVAFPKLLINMVKTAEMTGELPEVLDDMADYYTESEKTRKQMITAMIYPSIVLVMSIGVITFIMIFVIPQFVEIYSSMDAADIPGFTKLVINISDFLKKYILWLAIGIVIFFALMAYLYKNVKMFRMVIQWSLMHLPFFGNTVIYNEVTLFTKTFASLLSHNVFITDSMEILNKITNNEIYKMLILDTITNLAKGEKISTAFKDHWAFPVPAYEMIVTGEKTGELPEMMEKVSQYYQGLHKDSVTRIKSIVEPFITVFLTVIVGFIILAIIIPMFNMYSTVQSY